MLITHTINHKQLYINHRGFFENYVHLWSPQLNIVRHFALGIPPSGYEYAQ